MSKPVYETSILVVAGGQGSGKSTLIEGLFHLLEAIEAPTLWMDSTLDGGVLRKLKGEQSLEATNGTSLYETLLALYKNETLDDASIDWQLAEAPYGISGLHEGLSLYPSVSDGALVQEANRLLSHPLVARALSYGLPRLLQKNYRFVIMNAHNLALLRLMLPALPMHLLVLATPENNSHPVLMEMMNDEGHWQSCQVLMTQAKPNDPLPPAWSQWLRQHPQWQFIGRVPWFNQDDDWQGAYLQNLKSSLHRLHWDGVQTIQRP